MVFGAGILVVVARLVVWFVGCVRLLVLIVDTFGWLLIVLGLCLYCRWRLAFGAVMFRLGSW